MGYPPADVSRAYPDEIPAGIRSSGNDRGAAHLDSRGLAAARRTRGRTGRPDRAGRVAPAAADRAVQAGRHAGAVRGICRENGAAAAAARARRTSPSATSPATSKTSSPTLTEKSHRDPKTKLLNFDWFMERVESFLAVEQRVRWCGVGVVDINSFKCYNDTLGTRRRRQDDRRRGATSSPTRFDREDFSPSSGPAKDAICTRGSAATSSAS